MKFEDLKLSYGYPIQLQASSEAGRTQRFETQLVGCLPGQSILVTDPRRKRGRRLRSGQALVVRLMVANGIYLFTSSLEFFATVPFPILHLAYPSSVNFKIIRGATRVNVNLPITVKSMVNPSDVEVKGVIADISTSGARVEMDDSIGEIGDKISITAHVAIGSIQKDLSLMGVVRSRVERSTREHIENLPAVYGIEFNESDEDKQLVLNGYVFSEIVKNLEPDA